MALQQRIQTRVARSSTSPSPKKRKSTSPPRATGRSPAATRRRLSTSAMPRPKKEVEEEEEEEEEGEGEGEDEEEGEEVDSRMKARPSQRRSSREPVPSKTEGSGGGSSSGAQKRGAGSATGAAARRLSNGNKNARLQQGQEEEEDEEDEDEEGGYVPPPPPPSVSLRRSSARLRHTAEEEEEGEEEEGQDVDPRFYNNKKAPAPAPMEEEEEGGGEDAMDVDEVGERFHNHPPVAHAAPSPAAAGASSPPRRLSWGAAASYMPSFLWREPAVMPPPESPSKRVAFRQQLVERSPEQMQEPPGSSSRRASAAAAASFSSSSFSSSSSPAMPPASSPPRGIMKKTTPAKGGEEGGGGGGGGAGGRRPSSERMSFTSLLHRRESGASTNTATQPRRQQQQQHKPQQPQQQQAQQALLPDWPSMLTKGEAFLSGVRRLKMFFLVLSLLALWLLCLGGALKVGLALLRREECPPGHVRADIFGLWGECVVPQSTVKKLVKAVQQRTVEDLCKDPWAAAGAEEKGSWMEKRVTVNVPPRYREEELWGDVSMHSYPWGDLALRGVEREWWGPDLDTDYYVHLRGRPEVMRALWRRGAVLCRGEVFVAETYHVLAVVAVLALLFTWAYLKARAGIRQRQQVDKVKRMILNMLIADGDMAIDHVRADLLHGLEKDYPELGLTKSKLKTLWPAVVRAVEKDPRVSTAPVERKGRAMPHWIWLGKKLLKRVRHGGEGGGDGGRRGGGGGGGGWSHSREDLRTGGRGGGGRQESVHAVVI